jgi:alpha-tubulin suppressor-like RCC1 family protein
MRKTQFLLISFLFVLTSCGINSYVGEEKNRRTIGQGFAGFASGELSALKVSPKDYITEEDEPIEAYIGVEPQLADDSLLKIEVVSEPTLGDVKIAANGKFSYKPKKDANGGDSFAFSITDGKKTVSSTVKIVIEPVDDAPVGSNDLVFNVEEDAVEAISGKVEGFDAESKELTFKLTTPAAKGVVLSFNDKGEFTYKPNPNASGSDKFGYKVNDGMLESEEFFAQIAIAPLPDAPVANPSVLFVEENTPKSGMFSFVEVDEGDTLTFTIEQAPAKGAVVVSNAATGTFVYTPNDKAFDADNFKFKVVDSFGLSSIATVMVNIINKNDLPVIASSDFTMNEDTVANRSFTLDDSDGPSRTYVQTKDPTNGKISGVTFNVAGTGGSFIYTPNKDANGADEFKFVVNDGFGNSNEVTVKITITPVDDNPTASNSDFTTAENVAYSGTFIGADVDGDPLTFTLGTPAPVFGNVIINDAKSGKFTYTPNATKAETDTINFIVSDGSGPTATAKVTVTITNVNGVPQVSANGITTLEDTPHTASFNYLDSDGPEKIIITVTEPDKGTVSFDSPNNKFTYTPKLNANGNDFFVFKISDGTATSANVTVTVVITAVDDLPTADNGTLNVLQGIQSSGTLAGSDLDGDVLTFEQLVTSPVTPSKGVFTLVNATTGAFTYTPSMGATGKDTVTFRVKANGKYAPTNGIVTFNIGVVNKAPTAQDSTETVLEDGILTNKKVVASDENAGDILKYTLVTDVAHGNLNLSPITGVFSYAPKPNYHGQDSFTFYVSDGQLNSAPKTVTIKVTPVNDPPTGNAMAFSNLKEDFTEPLLIQLNGADVDLDALTYKITAQPTKGTFQPTSNVATGKLYYLPKLNANGTDSFKYRIDDGTEDSAEILVSIVIDAVNDAPATIARTINAIEDIAATGTLVATDPENDPITFSVVQPTKGTVTLSGANFSKFSYLSTSEIAGTDTFTFRATDPSGDFTEAVVTVNYTVTNDVPVLTAVPLSGLEDEPIVGRFTVTDNDNTEHIISVVTAPTKGTITNIDAAARTYTYTPNKDANGADSFSLKAEDKTPSSPGFSAVVPVTVNLIPVNDAPVALGVIVGGAELTGFTVDTGKTIAGQFIGKDVDYTGHFSGTPSLVDSAMPKQGTVTVAPNLGFTYKANANARGTDTFQFRLHDGEEYSLPFTVTVTFNVVPQDPVVADVTATINEDTNYQGTLTATDADPDNTGFTYFQLSQPTNGDITNFSGGTGTFTYVPKAHYFGNDSFQYRAQDSTGGFSNTATVAIKINADNDAPVANAATINLNAGGTGSTTLTGSDIENSPLTFKKKTDPAHGTITFDGNTVQYTATSVPPVDDSFQVAANDGQLDSASVAVTVKAAPAVLATVAKVAGGSGFFCALMSNQDVKCWGLNADGQLGLGDKANRGDGLNEMGDSLPIVNLGLKAKDIAVGGKHACAILSDDSVKCWGNNSFGQLGIGNTVNMGDDPGEMGSALPKVDFGTSRKVAKLTAGAGHTCALFADNTAACWGSNANGELGVQVGLPIGDASGEMGTKLLPINFGVGRTVKQIQTNAAAFHTCVILDTDRVRCWGKNDFGQLGQNDSINRSIPIPLLVPDINFGDVKNVGTVTQLTVGGGHNCVVLTTGLATCWGAAALGQLANGDGKVGTGNNEGEMPSSLVFLRFGPTGPLKPGESYAIAQLTAGKNFTCALGKVTSDNVVSYGSYCWGENSFGQLGLGNADNIGSDMNFSPFSKNLVDFGKDLSALQLSAAQDSICAVLGDKKVKCWGANQFGQLGLGDVNARGDSAGEMGDSLNYIDLGNMAP